MKLHVVYDPKGDVPTGVEITAANVNDVEIGRQVPIRAPARPMCSTKDIAIIDWWTEDQ